LFDQPQVFIDGIEPTDIHQGWLGNCYFLATLASIARNPERVKTLFYTKEANPAGIYMVSFYLNGLETPVIVDDHFPTIYENQAAFA
jgi:hypothetical protein